MTYNGKYTEALLKPIVEESKSLTQVLRSLGLRAAGGNYSNIKKHIVRLKLDTNHFTGRGWSKSYTEETNETVAKISKQQRIPDNEIFIENSRYNYRSGIKKRLLKMGWEYKCSVCGISSWQGKELSLQLDHINGIYNDNRFENLRFLCPNCHSQTNTFAGRNLGR